MKISRIELEFGAGLAAAMTGAAENNWPLPDCLQKTAR